MGNKPTMTLEEMYFKFKLPSIPQGVMMSDFEKEVFYTLNFLRTQPGLMRQRLKRVTKKFKIKKKKLKERKKFLAHMSANKMTCPPIRVDKDIYYACRYWNEKFVNTDFMLGGVLVYLRKLRGEVKGLEHTSFDWKDSGEDFILYVFLNEDFTSPEDVCPFFSDKVTTFGCWFSENRAKKNWVRMCWVMKPEVARTSLAVKGLI